MYDIVAVGELLIDFIYSGENEFGFPLFSAFPGGAPGNFLTASTVCGLKTALIAKVGTDVFARKLINELDKLKIDSSQICMDDNFFTTLAFVTHDSKGEREFSFARKPGADTQLKIENVNLSMIDNTRSIYFGTTSQTQKPSCSAVKNIIEYASNKGKLVLFDPNIRLSLWNNVNDAIDAMKWGLMNSNIVKLGYEEAELISKGDVSKITDIIINDFGVDLVFITMGKKGCQYSSKNYSGYIAGLKTDKTIDTTGAGDIFFGSLVSKILKTKKKIQDITQLELKKALEFATVAAGLSTTKRGGITSVHSLQQVHNVLQKT